MRAEQVAIAFPDEAGIHNRLENVLTTLYLLFNEGYYSSAQDITLRRDLCFEAMRLTHLLIENPATNLPAVNALFALMSFQASRFEARTNIHGEVVLYDDQDEHLWDKQLIAQGDFFLQQASQGNTISKYHLEAGIAYWHTLKSDTKEKWENILQLYNRLLIIEYSPIAALNRTYALSKANGKEEAIAEAEKLQLNDHHLYHSLLGELYTGINNVKAVEHFQTALGLVHSPADKQVLMKKIQQCE